MTVADSAILLGSTAACGLAGLATGWLMGWLADRWRDRG